MQNPYLALIGPTRSVVMKDDSIPVTIEAELKVKSTDEADDKYLMLAAARLPSVYMFFQFQLQSRYASLYIQAQGIRKSVEAVIFMRAIKGTWSTGFSGYIAASPLRPGGDHNIVISEFGCDGPLSDNGDVRQTRYVVAVEEHKYLVVYCSALNNKKKITKHCTFRAQKKGRSVGTLEVGGCTLEIIVAWSLIRPVCEELVRDSEMEFASEMM
jgi:hypothetical protein